MLLLGSGCLYIIKVAGVLEQVLDTLIHSSKARILSTYRYILTTIKQIGFKPIIWNSMNPILLTAYDGIWSVSKAFWKSTKTPQLIFLSLFLPYIISNINKGMRCRILLSKSKLSVINNAIVIKKGIQSFIHNFFQYFFNIW